MEDDKQTSLLHTHIPLVTAVLVGIWLIGTTITLTVQWVTIGTKIDALAVRLDTRMSVIEQTNLHRWTVEMHELWCARTEQKNVNWKCGDIPRPLFPKTGSAEFWKPDHYGAVKGGG